jgi:hypothetical protein
MKMIKPATEIMLLETRTQQLAAFSTDKSKPTYCTLGDKIEELVLKVGYSNAQALTVVIQILTVGKVRIDFRDYNQRLQLRFSQDIMNRSDAMEVFDSHLAHLRTTDLSEDGFTQRIMIQAPRPR